MSEATVLLLGTFDTKGAEYLFAESVIKEDGCRTLTVDVGVLGDGAQPVDIDRHAVAAAAGTTIGELIAAGDRGRAVTAMAEGARVVVEDLFEAGRFDAIMALGGSGGASIAAHVMRALPLGVPKLILSTLAAGDTRPFVGESDIAMMHSVVDIAGLNRVSRAVIANAAHAVAGMASAPKIPEEDTAGSVGLTMFGVTTACVTRAREGLESEGLETLVFNANGTGGRSLERLLRKGLIDGTIDVTLTELADELVGGILSAGPDRPAPSGRRVPRVFSAGALDMVNFGPADTVPERYRERLLYRHNPAVTLMRTTASECAELGKRLAQRVNRLEGPAAVVLPLRAVSALSAPGQPFCDPEADAALFGSIREGLADSVALTEVDAEINDPGFAGELLRVYHELQHQLATDKKE